MTATTERFIQGVYGILMPLVRLLVRLNITPNVLTTIGVIINMFAAAVFIIGAEIGVRGDFSYIGWGSALILFAGLFDMLDGQVARKGNMASIYGGIYDSVMDRYSELIMFLGICYYLVSHSYLLSSLFAFIAMIGSIMTSYTRARAEGAGLECNSGLMQRPTRILIISLSGLLCSVVSGIIGATAELRIGFVPFHVAETIAIFTVPITIVAVLSNITAVRRLLSCRTQARV